MRFAPLLALVLAGCAAPQVHLDEGAREYVATDYDDVLDTWTRDDRLILFSELETALTVNATFETWDFRWAYAIRYAHDYRLTVPQRQRLLASLLRETRKQHEFFVALHGPSHKQSDLTQANSAWIVRLIDSTGTEVAPAQIQGLKKPTILERRYYPYNTVWRRSFRIRFPVKDAAGKPTIAPDAEWLGLRFAGAMGNTDLIWRLKPEAE